MNTTQFNFISIFCNVNLLLLQHPDGKASVSEIMVESSHSRAMVLWSSDDEQQSPTSPPPPRLPPRSPRLNIRKYISPTQSPPTSPPKKSPPTQTPPTVASPIQTLPAQTPPSSKSPPTSPAKRAPRTTPVSPPKRSPPTSPPKKKVLTNGSIPIKPMARFVSNESTPSPDDAQSAIEESVRLLNTVGLANGMVELENQYKHMQQNHFQGKRYLKRGKDSVEPDDPGYFDDSRNALSDGEESGDFTQQIESLSKTVTDLQRSLSSLNDLDADDNDDDEPEPVKSRSASNSPRQPRRYPRRQAKRRTPPSSICQLPADAYSDSSCSDSDEKLTPDNQMGPDRHGNILDSLVMLSSSSDEESGFVYMSASEHNQGSPVRTPNQGK